MECWSGEEGLHLHLTLSTVFPCLQPWFHSSFFHLPSLPMISHFLVHVVVWARPAIGWATDAFFDLSCARWFSTCTPRKCFCPFDKANLVITCMPRQRAGSFQDGTSAWLSPGHNDRTLWEWTLSSAMRGRVQIQRKGGWSYDPFILYKCDVLTAHTWDWWMQGQKWSSEDRTQQ